ncbi:hypothetical protein [Micromonospora sp. WMMD1082]|uniref:hypothetical protein n=1 Tax=Micromonospora sp. WMMD1082 TaxID=3016104 RepID=UPI0024159E58|nr:hypothetical protein [Micromonospora sp. WMMD1082]MDG4795427.1 hypothetical protein [Micromonospora sp. WMMD1082]
MTATAALAVGGAVVAGAVPALAYPHCERYAGLPVFSGSNISGSYSVSCTQTVPSATLYGRIKEDRNNLPDVVHDTESITFTHSNSSTVSTSTCQNGDMIYIEAQINNETPAQSSGREMHC